MQLTKKGSIRPAVAAMTAALLGAGAVPAADRGKLETSLLLYSEVDRVRALEGIVGFERAIWGDRLLNVRLTYDGLTGASPNGATPAGRFQTFTRPSGNGSYSAKPGAIPLDDTFRDTRFSIDAGLAQPLGRLAQLSVGAHFSSEHDYSSIGLNAGVTRDLFRKNTTLGVSAAYTHDVVSPVGGAPIPMSAHVGHADDEEEPHEHEDDDDEGEGTGPGKGKDVFDVVLSMSQVLDRMTIARLNYSFSHSSGYLNDPYKLLSVIQGNGATDPGEPVGYLYESRPSVRNKHALFAGLRRYLWGNTVDLSYRFFWDDWGMTSHTAELFYRQQLGGGHFLQPHFRIYNQTSADFYYWYLVDGQTLPQYASADYRLADFNAYTIGLQYGIPFGEFGHLTLGGEYYMQLGKRGPPNAIGVLRDFDLFPDMKVFMIRLGFSYDL
jgi:hypothetical protein